MKKIKGLKNAHTSNSKRGMGDYYGTGIRAKVGKIRNSYLEIPMSNKKLGKAPKSMA